MIFPKSLALAVGLLVLGTACSSKNPGSPASTGGVQVTVRADALTGSQAGIVWLSLTDTAAPPNVRWFSGIPSNGAYVFNLSNLVTGNYTLDAYAYMDGAFDPIAAGGPNPADFEALGVPVTIAPGTNSIATVYLQQTAPAGTVNNNASRVLSLFSSKFNVYTGVPAVATATLNASVSDADGDPMTCNWSVSPAAAGSFSPVSNAVGGGAPPSAGHCLTTFTPASGYNGLVSVALELVDGHAGSPVATVVSIALNLSPTASASATIPVAMNGTPDITAFGSSAGMLLADGTSTAALTVRTFDDVGDVTSAAFSVAGAACGSVNPLAPAGTPGAPGITTFQATYTAGLAAGDCTIVVSVQDNKGSAITVGSLVLHQVAAWPTYYGAEFRSVSQSATRVDWTPDLVLGGSTSTIALGFELFDVNVTPNALINNSVPGFALTYSTTDAGGTVTDLGFGAGSVATAWDASYSSTACVTPPAAAPYTLGYTITATASLPNAADPANPAISTYVFPVTVHCLSVAIDQLGASTTPGATYTFSASVLVGDTGVAANGVAWSVVETGGGSIDAAGVYTAPATAGTYTVMATSIDDGSVVATAPIVVQ